MGRAALIACLALLALGSPGAARAAELVQIATPSRHVDPARAVFNGAPPPELRATVLLPDGYTPERRWPVLYLLHGLGDTHETWSRPDRGDVAAIAGARGAIVVMPEAGRGFYTSWFNGGRRGDPGWERFYLDELIPLVEDRFPILPGRANHAIAGLSMGGMGATYLASQRPDYFGAAAAFSGFVQHQPPEVEWGLRALGGPEYEVIFGPMDGPYATAHNPARLVGNLRHTRLFVAAGDGVAEPGVQSEPAAIAAGGAVELGLRLQNEELVAAAREAGVDTTYRPQSGVHDWPYWRRHLAQAIEWGLFAPVAEDPAEWTYSTIASEGRMWGLRYAFTAPPPAVATFARTGGLLRAAGEGEVRITDLATGCAYTAALPFERALPGPTCGRIEMRVRPRRLQAGRRGRLRVRVVGIPDGGHAAPLAGARVRFGGREGLTGPRGRLSFRVRPPLIGGFREVTATHPGLEPATARLRVVARRR